MSVSPPLGFWNLAAIVPHKEANHHFTDPEVSFLGTAADRAQRLGVELTLALINAMFYSGLLWEEDPDDFLKKLSYVDESGCKRNLLGFGQFHPTQDTKKIKCWLGY